MLKIPAHVLYPIKKGLKFLVANRRIINRTALNPLLVSPQYAAIVGMVNNSTGQAGTTLDLTNPAQLRAVLATSAVALNNVTGGSVTLSTAVLSAAANGMSSVNTLISSATASGANSTDVLVQVSGPEAERDRKRNGTGKGTPLGPNHL